MTTHGVDTTGRPLLDGAARPLGAGALLASVPAVIASFGSVGPIAGPLLALAVVAGGVGGVGWLLRGRWGSLTVGEIVGSATCTLVVAFLAAAAGSVVREGHVACVTWPGHLFGIGAGVLIFLLGTWISWRRAAIGAWLWPVWSALATVFAVDAGMAGASLGAVCPM